MLPTKEDFEKSIRLKFERAIEEGKDYIEIVSGDIHRELGGYPGKNHRMPCCCTVMYSVMKNDDIVIEAPKKGKGATLKIRYML